METMGFPRTHNTYWLFRYLTGYGTLIDMRPFTLPVTQRYVLLQLFQYIGSNKMVLTKKDGDGKKNYISMLLHSITKLHSKCLHSLAKVLCFPDKLCVDLQNFASSCKKYCVSQ